ncbi:MAG: hypothetical protein D6782_12040 [Alphaproteobacteria bacterium]|nr:MAG: hypothetical protein D6782_12040 [Alphaproteobacteria bacterium]
MSTSGPIFVRTAPPPPAWQAFLRDQAARLHAADVTPRPWHWRALHNPWSRAAALFDAWGFLDLCSDAALLQPVRTAIGDDIILFDSFWLPDPWDEGGNGDALFFPVAPLAGVTLLCDFAAGAAAGPGPTAFGARYFPATARYLRDPAHPAHMALMERLPWVNYAAMPLWLVAGEDRAGNDFVTGFNPRAAFWSEAPGF